jgi:hypothetical protein
MIDLSLQGGHTVAGVVELFAGPLERHLKARDPLLEFHGLRELQVPRGGAYCGST